MKNFESVISKYGDKLYTIQKYAKKQIPYCYGLWTLSFLNEVQHLLEHYLNEDKVPEIVQKAYKVIDKIGDKFFEQFAETALDLSYTPTLDFNGVLEVLEVYMDRYGDEILKH